MKELLAVAAQFMLEGEPTTCESYGSGYIHDTFLVKSLSGNIELKYILQKINTYVFRQPDVIMRNIIRISDHLKQSGIFPVVFNCLYLQGSLLQSILSCLLK